ncbi:hypothetical protein T11_3299 [Trichinella zimbabwensis]|uniref:Uncharacterized protein n=1 Tax=Trichinella zimbabwensis TaxID=268475 RepID=A0A0V1GQJ5_9BILA|nr:hypothetical protein T11_14213 [Trichinella zimbabwensis]KRZ02998.1 hypothetical protein T11_3299 [Trichinella zimbabwensis]
MATAFLPVPQVDTVVTLLEAGTTGNLSAFLHYFLQEWMTDDRLPLWNVHGVNIPINNHLECWYNRLKKAGGNKLGLNPAAGSIRQIGNRYAEKQRRVVIYSGEYTSGRRTSEQFLEALMYLTPEQI